MEPKDFLIKMSNATGVSGYETERAQIVTEVLGPLCDDVKTDPFGNLICLKKGKGKGKIMFAAHMDEIGLMVSHIDEQGYVKLTTLGGFDQRTLLAQEVIIHGKEKVFGVIGVAPPHLTKPEDRKKAIKLEELAVDTGYSADELKKLIKIGDLVTINRKCVELLNNRVSGKTLDDVAGVATYLYALNYLKDYSHDADVYFVATTQEEVGCRGAITSTYNVKPDIGLAIDVGFARTPELTEDQSSEFGGGPQISMGPNIHRRVFERLKESGKKNGIKTQINVIPAMSGTDAYTMQISGDGVATGVISIPLKYMHTSIETITMNDIESTGRLLAEFVKSFNNCDMEEFLCL